MAYRLQMRPGYARPRLLSMQCCAVAIALAVLGFWPPNSGRLLLVPLWSGDKGEAVRLALGGGALLIGVGPVRGSVIVDGRRADLADAAWNQQILMMAAPSAGCGQTNQAGVNS